MLPPFLLPMLIFAYGLGLENKYFVLRLLVNQQMKGVLGMLVKEHVKRNLSQG
jgi:hypothetical protein